MYHIYQIKNLVNGHRYIGFTTSTDPYLRWKRHIYHTNSGSSYHIHRAIRKYGLTNFSFEILASGNDELAGIRLAEPLLIEIFKPEYNMTSGGDGLRTPTEEVRRKMSIANIGRNPWNKGKKGVQVAWNKGKRGVQKAWNKGIPHSPETRQKISKAKMALKTIDL